MSDQIVRVCFDGQTFTIKRVGKFVLSSALTVEESRKKGKHQTAKHFVVFYGGFNHVSWFVAEKEIDRTLKSPDLEGSSFLYFPLSLT
jgi:hypothetical protein